MLFPCYSIWRASFLENCFVNKYFHMPSTLPSAFLFMVALMPSRIDQACRRGPCIIRSNSLTQARYSLSSLHRPTLFLSFLLPLYVNIPPPRPCRPQCLLHGRHKPGSPPGYVLLYKFVWVHCGFRTPPVRSTSSWPSASKKASWTWVLDPASGPERQGEQVVDQLLCQEDCD